MSVKRASSGVGFALMTLAMVYFTLGAFTHSVFDLALATYLLVAAKF